MEPLKDLFADYLMRLAEQYPGLDDKLTAYIPADKIHDYANAYGPGGQFYDGQLQAQAARASGRQQPPAFAVDTYVRLGFGSVFDGVFTWSPAMTAPYTGLPKL